MFRFKQVWNRSFRHVTHGLDIVTVGIAHEGAVIMGVIMRANAGCAIIAPAGRHRRLVESVDRGAVLGLDATCSGLSIAPSPLIQKSGLPSAPKPAEAACPVCCGVTSITMP
jgi:hypothetical protein